MLFRSLLVEFKKSALKNMGSNILEASKQANIAVIVVKEELTIPYMKRFTNGQFNLKDRKNIEKIIILTIISSQYPLLLIYYLTSCYCLYFGFYRYIVQLRQKIKQFLRWS